MPLNRAGRLPPTREVAAHVRCGIGSWEFLEGRCLRMGGYVSARKATAEAHAAGAC